MTNLMQTFESWLENKINETCKTYLDNQRTELPHDAKEDRIRELAREEAIDVIEHASYDISVSA